MKKKCELCNKRKATQACIYSSMYLCDDCYSKLGNMTDDFQGTQEQYDKFDLLMEKLLYRNLFLIK